MPGTEVRTGTQVCHCSHVPSSPLCLNREPILTWRSHVDHVAVSHVDGPVLVATAENLNQVSRSWFGLWLKNQRQPEVSPHREHSRTRLVRSPSPACRFPPIISCRKRTGGKSPFAWGCWAGTGSSGAREEMERVSRGAVWAGVSTGVRREHFSCRVCLCQRGSECMIPRTSEMPHKEPPALFGA